VSSTAAEPLIRSVATIEEFRACVDLQEASWGVGFSERVSPAILKVGQMLGGVSAGAYDADGRLVGFVFGLTGLRDGEVVHWSDMLAIVPELRDSGLGRRLKAWQREQVMGLGVRKMFWTFDPLRSRNAHLNIARLGIVVREYRENMYGDTDSPLHRGIGTDRFVALWLLDSDRVERAVAAIGGRADSRGGAVEERLAGPDDPWPGSMEDAPSALDVDASGPGAAAADRAGPDHLTAIPVLPRPGAPRLDLDAHAIRVAIPADLGAVMEADSGLALAWRVATRAVFSHYLANGYEVRYFQRGAPVSTYGLARRTDLSADPADALNDANR